MGVSVPVPSRLMTWEKREVSTQWWGQKEAQNCLHASDRSKEGLFYFLVNRFKGPFLKEF